MTKRALLVARVSTETQAKFGYSLQTQLVAMRNYAEAHAFEVAGEITDDCSGTIPMYERPGGRKVYHAIKRKEIDALIFYTIDRASRDEDVIDFLLLKRDLREAGIELHFADTGKSDHDSVNGIIEYIRVSEAGRERSKIVERNTRGKRAKADAGKWVGAGLVPYGFRKIGKGRDTYLEVYEPEATVVRRIFSLYIGAPDAKPLAFTGIAKLLHEEGVPTPGRGRKNERGWHSGAVRDIINRRSNLGEFHYSNRTIQLPHLALIDQLTFDKAQTQKALNRSYAKRNCRANYLLRKRIKCVCGTRLTCDMNNQHKSPGTIYYCSYQKLDRHLKRCHEPYVNGKKADAMVWGWLTEIFENPEKMREGLGDFAQRQGVHLVEKKERRAGLTDLIERAERKIQRLAAEFGNAEDELEMSSLRSERKLTIKQREAWVGERETVEQELRQIEMTTDRQMQILGWAAEIHQGIANGDVDFDAKRRLVDNLEVEAQVEYREGRRGLFVRCVLAYADKWLPFEGLSSLIDPNLYRG